MLTFFFVVFEAAQKHFNVAPGLYLYAADLNAIGWCRYVWPDISLLRVLSQEDIRLETLSVTIYIGSLFIICVCV